MHAIPLALATLSTTAAAINSFFDPISIIVGPPCRCHSPVSPVSFGSRLVGRQEYHKQHISPALQRHNTNAENLLWKQPDAVIAVALPGRSECCCFPNKFVHPGEQSAGAYLYIDRATTTNSVLFFPPALCVCSERRAKERRKRRSLPGSPAIKTAINTFKTCCYR